jgi:hypothetical protein
MLFAISILVTWVPASVNRIHGLKNPTDPSFALNVGSALVLPLQGFWNAVIYFVTSLNICKTVLTGRIEARDKSRRVWTGDVINLGGRRRNNGDWIQAGDDSMANSPRGLEVRDGDSIMGLSENPSIRSFENSF